ncbi:2'-5' RNA ligase family protein [Pedobacter sp. AW31-3R]|uniref:2'-5' RNA ligase family protein n=1 Tax=Pedobacter sp. AW31-3R TaxID=3445781 RepID=UPI003FA0BAA7
MMGSYEPALILTLRMDEASALYFDGLRQLHFPPERNFLKAHLTLFHKLPEDAGLLERLSVVDFAGFEMEVTGLINLGAGVAFRLESEELLRLRHRLMELFEFGLSAQDSQGFRGHVTVQNKTSPEQARTLLAELSAGFKPFRVQALGLDIWYYLGGPWAHAGYYPFGS